MMTLLLILRFQFEKILSLRIVLIEDTSINSSKINKLHKMPLAAFHAAPWHIKCIPPYIIGPIPVKLEDHSHQSHHTQKTRPRLHKDQSREITTPAGSRLMSLDNRLTYIFSHGDEVGSIHFDKGRGEIFFKGHNLRNMEVEEWHWQVMEELRQLLAKLEDKMKSFADSYAYTLDRIIFEKEKQSGNP